MKLPAESAPGRLRQRMAGQAGRTSCRRGGRAPQSRVSVRAALLAVAAIVLGSGCSEPEGGNDTGTSPARPRSGEPPGTAADASPEQSAAPGELSILSWSDYFVPEVLARFSESQSATVALTEVDNSEQLIQALQSEPGRYDLIVVDDKSIPRLIDLRLLGELDLSKLPGISHLSPRFRSLSFDPGNRHSVPYLWGTTALVYRRDRVMLDEVSWNALWEDRFKGRMAILDEPEDMYFIALLAEGCDPLRATAPQVDGATAKLTDSFTRQGGRMLDYVSALDALESGALDLVVTYSGDAAVRARENRDIVVAIPEEGAPLWLDSFVLSRDAANADLAHRFIEYMLAPEVAAETANALKYGSPNAAAIPLVDAALLEDRSLYPDPATLARCRFISFEPESQEFVSAGIRRLFESIRQRGIHPERGGELAAGGAERREGPEAPASDPGAVGGTSGRQAVP